MAEEDLLKRKMPQDIQAEEAVLGAMLINNEIIGQVAEILTGEDFFRQQNGALFHAITELYRENRAADPVTILDRLRENGIPEEMGSADLIRRLIESVPSSARAMDYANIVYEKSTLRRLIHAAEEIETDC